MSNILDKTSLLLVPSGYKASKLYSVIPDDGSGDFTSTRGAIAHRIASDQYIHPMANDVPLLDYSDGGCPNLLLQEERRNEIVYPYHPENTYWTKDGLDVELDASTAVGNPELVTNGDFANWTTDDPNGWTVSAENANNYVTESSGACRMVSDGTYIEIKQDILIVGKTYMITIDITDVTAGFLYVKAGTTPKRLDTVKNYTLYIQCTGDTYLHITRGSSSTNDVTIDNISIKEVQGFASPFKDASGNVELVGRKLVEDASTGYHSISSLPTSATIGDTYVSSWIIKDNGIDEFAIRYSGAADTQVYYNHTTNTFSNAGANVTTYGKIDLLGGWYLLYVGGTLSITSYSSVMYFRKNGTSSYQGDGTSGIYLAYTQLEKGDYASTPITPVSWTPGSVYTRLVDSDTVTVPAGVTKIIEIDSDGNENIITTIPTDYSIPIGRWSQIRMEHD